MDEYRRISQQFEQIGVIPVVRMSHQEQAIPLTDTLRKGRLPVAEVTLRTSCALDGIAAIHEAYPEFLVGAGTVLCLSQAREAFRAGAKFIVSPGLIPDVVQWCLAEKIPVFPGVCTPTEICQAIALGLHELKFFPAADYGGLQTIKSLLQVFDNIRFMPTGGVNKNNLVNNYTRAMKSHAENQR